MLGVHLQDGHAALAVLLVLFGGKGAVEFVLPDLTSEMESLVDWFFRLESNFEAQGVDIGSPILRRLLDLDACSLPLRVDLGHLIVASPDLLSLPLPVASCWWIALLLVLLIDEQHDLVHVIYL